MIEPNIFSRSKRNNVGRSLSKVVPSKYVFIIYM